MIAARRANTLPAGLTREERVAMMSAPVTGISALHPTFCEPPADDDHPITAADAGPGSRETTQQ